MPSLLVVRAVVWTGRRFVDDLTNKALDGVFG
jgi:hypothetical protein